MTPTKTTPAEMVVCLTTVHLENDMLIRGDSYPADDPRVLARPKFFAPASAPQQEIRRLESALFEDAATATWQPEPAPPPIRMRAWRPFTAEIITSTQVEIAKGAEYMSDSDIFLDNAKYFESASQPPRKRGK